MFLAGRATLGVAIALAAIAAAATVPVHRLLEPPSAPASLTRFADDSTLTLEGEIARAPEHAEGDRTYLYIRAERAGIGAILEPARGLVRVTVLATDRFHLGDEIRITSRIRFPRNDGNPGEFDYRAWLLREGIAATMFADTAKRTTVIEIIGHRAIFPASAIEAVRTRIGVFIDANLNYPESVEMRALIIGDRGGINESLRQRFALTGMAHLLVISGLHLGIVAAVAFGAMRWLMGFLPALAARGYANKFAAVAAALAVCAYAAIAGHHISTIRALVMVLAYALAILIDRAREIASSLALAALVLCFAIPGSTADIGFQLSFASVLVILFGMRRFAAWWRWHYANPFGPRAEPSRLNLVAEWIAGYVAVSFWLCRHGAADGLSFQSVLDRRPNS